MSPLPVNSDTSSSYVGGGDSVTDKDAKCSSDMGVRNSIRYIEVEGDSTEMAKNVLAETNNNSDSSGETQRPDEISPRVCSLIEEKGYSKIKLKNVDIDPNNLPVKKSCFNVIPPQTPDELSGFRVPCESIQNNNVKVTDPILTESDKVTKSEKECQLVDHGNQIDVKEKDLKTSCESLNYVNTELRNIVPHSSFEENEIDHNDLNLKNSMCPKAMKGSKSVIVLHQQMKKETSNECGTFSDDQQESIHCKSGESYILEESSSDSHICREKNYLEKENCIEANILSNIVKEECANCDNPHKLDDNDVEDKNVKIKSVTETLHSKFTKPSVGESCAQNISDSIANLSTGTLNEVLEDTVSFALEEKKAELDSIGIVKHPSKFIEGTEKKTALFHRGSFPRIAVRDTGGLNTIKRLQRRILMEREKREMLVNGCVLKKRPVKKNIPKKNKNILIKKDKKRYSSEKAMSKETKIKCSPNNIKLKKLQVSLERIDEKLLSKYNVDLNYLRVSAAINKTSNENNQSLKASNLSKNKIKNLELSTCSVLQNDKTIGVEDNMGLPRKDDEKIPLKKQTEFKSLEAKLKHVSVRVLKIDDYTLSKYGYGSQKLKTIITHPKTGGEDSLDKKKTNHILNLNNVKYPAQILLSKIDLIYPNILKQTLKINMNEKNKNSKNSSGVRKKTKVSPKNIKSDSCIDLKTVQISVPKIDYEAFSKSGVILKTSCKGKKIKKRANTKDSGAVKSSDIRLFDVHSQVKLSKKRKADSINGVKIDSKENSYINGESWDLKQAKVRLMKLDNSVLP